MTEYIKDNFLTDGMCADVCIHDTDEHNPHAHIMVTVGPLAENGQWQYKTEKRMRKHAEKYPELCQLADDDGRGGLRFGIDKSRISIRLTDPYSEERRRKQMS